VAREYGGTVRFAVENYGESELARRLGVTRYPAIFVDDVLVATPSDFGFYGRGQKEEGGRYAPLRSAEAHQRFRTDLARMIDLLLAGRRDEARAVAAPSAGGQVATLPSFALVDLDGRPVSQEDLAGRVVLVEFWATWCPPCRGTLAWLGELRRRHGDGLVVLAVAVESAEKDVRRIAGEMALPIRWAMGTPDVARAFGDVSAVPTLLVFDGAGRAAGAFFGAPPGLHDAAEKAVAAAGARAAGGS
jgi:thiol-disulfide isomerase/thioredoxin